MEKVHGVLIMTLLEMLQFLVLIIVHHFILKIEKVLLGEELDGIIDSTGAAKNNLY